MPGHSEFDDFLFLFLLRLSLVLVVAEALRSFGLDSRLSFLISMAATFVPPLLISITQIFFPPPSAKYTIYNRLNELHLRLCGYLFFFSLTSIAALSLYRVIMN